MTQEMPSKTARAQRDPEIQKEISKFILEALKNLVLLGALKYVADKVNSVALEMLFILGGTAFWAFYTSYVISWDLKPFRWLWKNWHKAARADMALTIVVSLVIQFTLLMVVHRTAANLAAAH
jgi:hypothetical protein